MTIAVMQPYFLPYIGYFQLIKTVDKFVVYDNIEFTKKGWINRNRILVNGKDEYFTLPLKKDSDYLHIDKRRLADLVEVEKNKILRKITACYKKAPFFEIVFPLVEKLFNEKEDNLFKFIYNSLLVVCRYLGISTEFIVSSSLPIDHQLKAQDKVISICKALNATHYINPIGGVELYSNKAFEENDIKLSFIKSGQLNYQQFQDEFIPWLSILDVMMFNSKEKIEQYLQSDYILI